MKKKIALIFIICVSLLFIGTSLKAADMVDANSYEESYVLSEAQNINNVFLNQSEKKIIYDKDINHSGITLGIGEIEILSNLRGIQLIYSQDSVHIKGKVNYPMILAQNVVIEGKVDGDLIVVAPSIYIKEGAEILGDIVALTTDIEISGTVTGNVNALVNNNIKVDGQIKGSLHTTTMTADLENSKIEGDILLKTNSNVAKVKEKYPNAVIKTIEQVKDNNTKNVIITGIISIVVFTLLGYLFIRKDNNIFSKFATQAKDNILRIMLSGIIALIIIPFVALILVILSFLGIWMIAIPIAIVYAALVVTACMLAILIVGATVFEIISKKVIKANNENTNIKKLGLLFLINTVIYILTLIPIINKYVIILMYILSIGVLISYCLKAKTNKEE